jgi:hypothetical protein
MDSQIAWEIGHTSGGATLAEVYGGAPPHWLAGDGPKMSWLPSGKPAWSVLWPPENIIPFPIPPAVAEPGRTAVDLQQTSGANQE